MGLTETFAEFITGTSYCGMPSAAVTAAKKEMLDGLGVMLVGSREAEGNEVQICEQQNGLD